MMIDPVADMLTRIRNANVIKAARVAMPVSKIKVNIAQILKDEGFIKSYSVHDGKPCGKLEIDLKYGPDGEYVIRRIERVSKPGRRVYTKVDDLPSVLRGMGIYVLSTQKGVISDRTARELHVGGEVLCKVY